MEVRTVVDRDGKSWEAFAAYAIVAHGKEGTILAFRSSGAEGTAVVHSTVTFNSVSAAELALHSMSEKELLRRLSLSRKAAGV
jgi:hypothetical protein